MSLVLNAVLPFGLSPCPISSPSIVLTHVSLELIREHNRRDQQELSLLCLHLLQAALVYVNTLMIQDILAEPEWEKRLTVEDKRGLTPLFTSNMTPYGDIKLNMGNRLALSIPTKPESEKAGQLVTHS